MKSLWKSLSTAVCITAAFMVFPLNSSASDWNRKTLVTTSQPMEIPGNMVLPAGQYTLKLLDLSSDRNIVEFLSGDERKIYNTVIAIPQYRVTPAEKTELSFYEQEPNRAHAVRSWTTAGSTSGLEFIYPKARARELAMLRGESTMPAASNVAFRNTASDLDDSQPSAAVTPSAPAVTQSDDLDGNGNDGGGHEARVEPKASAETIAPTPEPAPSEEDSTPPEAQEATKPAAPESDTSTESKELPKTAGVQELMLLIGMGSATAAFAVRKFRR